MRKFFNINEISEKKEVQEIVPGDESKIHRARFDFIHEHKIKSLKKLAGELPGENEVFFIETTNSFNAFTFIVYIVKYVGVIDELFIATYSINQRILSSLTRRLQKNEIRRVHLYIADSIKNRVPKIKDQLDIMQEQFKNFTVEYAWTHKKVIAIRVGDDYFVVEGSGNFSENSAEEQYVFVKSKQLYDFKTRNSNFS